MGARWKLIVGSVVVVATLGFVPAGGAHAALPPNFDAHGSVEQVYITHGTPGDALTLDDAAHAVVASGTVDDLGSFLFQNVMPGDGYTVNDGAHVSAPLHVMTRTETPPQSFYDAQHLNVGFGYITTRDGTTLSAETVLPGPPDKGPYPTVIEYSGYDPSHPGSPQPSEQIAQLLGYATVGVNIRGTGCSGGAFNFFEPLQSLDGYDVVEAVAAQPWVLNHKPGMVGISYPGIAQTFVAATRPPHLAAVAPLSVMADAYRSLARPGGVPNTGFPREWAQERDDAAQPFGQGWEHGIVDAGGPNGAQCAENQLLRHQNTKLVGTFDNFPFREPVDLADQLSPQLLDENVNVPFFMGGAWQDEQTGGQSSLIWEHLGGPNSQHKLFGTNGTHVDSLVAELNRWYEFLEFYVARRIPHVSPAIRALAPVIIQAATGIPNVQLEQDRFDQYTNYADALHAYESEPPIRILFENGAGDPTNLGAPFGTYEMHFNAWPPPQVQPTSWYFGPDQTLSASAPTIPDSDGKASTSYVYDPTAKPLTDFHGGQSDIWAAHPDFDWRVLPIGKALQFDSSPLPSTTVMAGPGSVDLWLRSTAPDTDLEVTLTELRPDGQELYVQNGWLRASLRAVDASKSTALEPFHPDTSATASPLPAGQFVSARVALFPFAHIFRAGSRIRITVEAPNGNRPFWSFNDLPAYGTVINDVATSIGHASKVVLPVIPDPAPGIPAAYPPCGSLRGEPCRPIESSGAATNLHATLHGRSATITWHAASRAGAPMGGYVLSDNGVGIMLLSSTATSATINHIAFGHHVYTVTAYYPDGAHVTATPSNTVTFPSGRTRGLF